MEPLTFHDGRVELYAEDCLAVLKVLPDCFVDAVITDPPYHLTSIVKRFGGENAAPAKGNEAFVRASRGFMGQQWGMARMPARCTHHRKRPHSKAIVCWKFRYMSKGWGDAVPATALACRHYEARRGTQ